MTGSMAATPASPGLGFSGGLVAVPEPAAAVAPQPVVAPIAAISCVSPGMGGGARAGGTIDLGLCDDFTIS